MHGYATINNTNDWNKLQDEKYKLRVWAEVWQVKINYDKCSVLLFGSNNTCYEYYLNRQKFNVINLRKYLESLLIMSLIFMNIFISVQMKLVKSVE